MKRTRVKSAGALLSAMCFVLLTVSAFRSTTLGASGSPVAQQTPAATPAAAGVSEDGSAGAFLNIDAAAGFPLDPFLVSVQGGGPAEAGALSEDCSGYVSVNPIVSIDYKGEADAVRAFFYSDGDTTLVVHTPDGAYLCGDDTSALILDPTVEITKPAVGRYEVWVGSKVTSDLIPGFLAFTTRADVDAAGFALSSLVKRPAMPNVVPVRDRLVHAAERLTQAVAAVSTADALEGGGTAVTKEFTATGELPAVELQTGDTLCGGLVTIIPDYAFDWTGDATSLSMYAEASGDTTLLVRSPDGSFACADDTVGADGANNLNPLLTIAEPAAGRYLVWVGRVDPSNPVTGVLTLSEAADAMPEQFNKQ